MKSLDENKCYQALKSHDARFDGRFYVGVTSTGIYCRPICTVRTPKRENCRFFGSATLAENHGFRPCLRCRPELAPGLSQFERSGHLASTASALIEDGFLGEQGILELAEKLNVSERHLRRVFQAEFGVTLIDYVQTHRLLLAKQLLTDTALPITEVAFSSGFSSVRRFNDLFKQRYRLNPSALRKAQSERHPRTAFEFDLAYRPPYQQSALLAFLSARAIAGVEFVHDGHYVRSVAVNDAGITHSGWIDVSFASDKPIVRARVSFSLSRAIPIVIAKIKRVFDLKCDPHPISETLSDVKGIGGLRVPGAFDGFELAVRAILGQQVSVKAAQTLAARLASHFGEPVETPHRSIQYLFPSASVIARCSVKNLQSVGITLARSHSIIALAKVVDSGRIDLTPSADVRATTTALTELPGIGQWTAEYIAMRALAWPDAFPHTDLGIRKALGGVTPGQILKIAHQWKPWRSYAAIALWQTLNERE